MAAQQFITVATFIDKVSADIVAERLIAAGIPAAVLGASSQLPSLAITRRSRSKSTWKITSGPRACSQRTKAPSKSLLQTA